MTRLARVWNFLNSLTGRIAVILVAGLLLATTAAIILTERARLAEFQRVQADRAMASAVDVISRLQRKDLDTERQLEAGFFAGAQFLRPGQSVSYMPNPAISAIVAARVPKGIDPALAKVPSAECMRTDPFWHRQHMAGFDTPSVPDCWLLVIQAPSGRKVILIDLPSLQEQPAARADTVFPVVIVLLCTLLALVVARLATAPLRRLMLASDAFARSIDAAPVPEAGPADVRKALATFNLMQERVRAGLQERTRLLAAIAHDLQTPLTRLRLRLEQVTDEDLRQRLLTDLSATLTMVRRGLDLARSSDSAEDWSNVDLDSVLSSLVADRQDMSEDVRLIGLCQGVVRVRPDALARCLDNIVDNAVKYAGSAEISCHCSGRNVLITVRDRGPGIPPDMLGRVFEPYVRGAEATRAGIPGSGIGLAIARAQAVAMDAELTLDNHPNGGAVARLRLNLVVPLVPLVRRRLRLG